MHHTLQTPNGRVLGLRLDPSSLGDEFYDVLAWADDHFPSYFVEQTDEHVYVCADVLRKMETSEREALRTEPLSAGEQGLTAEPEQESGGGSGQDGDDGGAIAEPAGR
jgi:hypothetical protein